MKKSSLTTSVVAGLAGVAGLVNVSSALNVNPDGLGQVLIYPYYTVNAQNSTLLSVVNTTDDVKAVKVRFLEGRNSKEVLDFNLYLSPFDVWTALVTDPEGDDEGRAVLRSSDTSCIVPRSVYDNIRGAAGQNFLTYEYAQTTKDGGPYHPERTREGHIEIIEMGRVVDDGDLSTGAGASVGAVDVQGANAAPFAGSRLATAATHNSAGVPNNCGLLWNAWSTTGQWTVLGEDADIDTPNGGLFGGGQIIDTSNGTNLSYNADAIEGFFVSESSDNLHSRGGSVEPSLAFAQSNDLGEATAVIFDNGTLYQFTFTGANAGRNAVSAVFMHNEIYNEYVTSDGLAADSEWVITFPTKRLHITNPLPGRLPFRSAYIGDNTEPFDGLVGACEPIDVEFFDREEQTSGFIPEEEPPSPAPPIETPDGLNLCFEAQIITFNQPEAGEVLLGNEPSAILGSWYPRNINLCQQYDGSGGCATDGIFSEGWVRMVLGAPSENFMYTDLVSADPTDPNILVGLPATGFWAANYVNGEAQPGLLANFGGIHRHRSDRQTYAGTVDPSPADPSYTTIDQSGLE